MENHGQPMASHGTPSPMRAASIGTPPSSASTAASRGDKAHGASLPVSVLSSGYGSQPQPKRQHCGCASNVTYDFDADGTLGAHFASLFSRQCNHEHLAANAFQNKRHCSRSGDLQLTGGGGCGISSGTGTTMVNHRCQGQQLMLPSQQQQGQNRRQLQSESEDIYARSHGNVTNANIMRMNAIADFSPLLAEADELPSQMGSLEI